MFDSTFGMDYSTNQEEIQENIQGKPEELPEGFRTTTPKPLEVVTSSGSPKKQRAL